MRLVFLSTTPSFSVMVTCRYHPVPPIRQASSRGSPRCHDAASRSLFSPSSSTRAATGLAGRAPAASAAPPAAPAGWASSLTKIRGSCRMMALEKQKRQKKTRVNYRDNSRDNLVRTR